MPERIRVLYVDDEPNLLEVGKLFLEESGQMNVDIATSAQQCLDSPILSQYDAIISDYQMPGINGIEFLKQVRVRAGDIPFILFTGRGREEVVIDAINNGADFYIQKGGMPDAQFAELAHKVHQAVVRRTSEREITSLFQAIPGAIGVVLDRVMLRVNDYLSTMTGYSREELEGHNTRFLYLNDEDYAAVGRMREQAYREGKADDVEVRWRRKDGTVIDVRVSAAPVDRSKPLAAMMYCTVDLTRMKRDHADLRAAYEQLKVSDVKLREQIEELARRGERLKKSEAEIAGILRAAPVSIGVMSADRVFLRVNDWFCETIGYAREEILGRNARFLYPDDDEYARAGNFYLLRAGQGSIKATETRFVRKDGTILDIGLYGTLIDPANPAAGNIFIALDITDEKHGQTDAVSQKKSYLSSSAG